MKRPSFQFYPADWSTDLALRRCSPSARGVWMDVLCALHNSDDQYGLLRWPLKEVASTVGAVLAHVRELVDKGVLKGSDTQITQPLIYVPRSGRKDGEPVILIATQPGPLWFSKRLVKDEHIRTIRGESTRFSAVEGDASKTPTKTAPKPPFGDGTSSSSSSSSSSSNNTPKPPKPKSTASPVGFAEVYAEYPKKVGKMAALRAWKAQRINGEWPDILLDVQRRKDTDVWRKNGGQFVPNPATYFNQRRWEDEQNPGTPEWIRNAT